jgi:tRNA threonylcarbamoyladenosine biosynthesis protein TsaB
MGAVVRSLAIETATVVCAIGVRDDESRWQECVRVLDRSRRHTEVLTTGVRALLDECGVDVATLDRVVVDCGPGLFTGLRVGIATAQALANGLGVDIVGVSSLDVLACAARDAGVNGDVIAMVDARRGELFVQRFHLNGTVVAREAPHVTSPTELAEELAVSSATITGDGALRYATVLAPHARDLLALDVPPVTALLHLGSAAQFTGATSVAPLYLREADAVANFATRDRP